MFKIRKYERLVRDEQIMKVKKVITTRLKYIKMRDNKDKSRT